MALGRCVMSGSSRRVGDDFPSLAVVLRIDLALGKPAVEDLRRRLASPLPPALEATADAPNDPRMIAPRRPPCPASSNPPTPFPSCMPQLSPRTAASASVTLHLLSDEVVHVSAHACTIWYGHDCHSAVPWTSGGAADLRCVLSTDLHVVDGVSQAGLSRQLSAMRGSRNAPRACAAPSPQTSGTTSRCRRRCR